MLTKAAILASTHLPTEEVHVPEWVDADGDDLVYVRGMTGAERDEFEASLWVDRDGQNVYDPRNSTAKALVRCIVDADGNRIFGDRDANELGSQPSSALMPLWRVARRLSGLGPEEVAEKARDFPPTTGSDSNTPSLNGSASPSLVS